PSSALPPDPAQPSAAKFRRPLRSAPKRAAPAAKANRVPQPIIPQGQLRQPIQLCNLAQKLVRHHKELVQKKRAAHVERKLSWRSFPRTLLIYLRSVSHSQLDER